MIKGFVPYETVKNLIDLYEDRDKVQDSSDSYEKLTMEIEVEKRMIQRMLDNNFVGVENKKNKSI